ncbi:MAG: phosphatase PAP2 family protein [Endomicrobia bacterium]|nr:phosphatase PAP2 family protein [Endomicrobiia bacterium]
MKKYISCLIILCLFHFHLYGEETKPENTSLPKPNIFHNIGENLLDSVTYNYGLNFIGAAAGTWIIIETGLDWKWRNTAFDNRWMENAGNIAMPLVNVASVATPLIFYISGKYSENEKTIIAAKALTQSLILTVAVQSTLKTITGRREPGLQDRSSLFDDDLHQRIYGEDDFSNVWDWFNMDYVKGWPSGHTANAFAAAATLSEIYHDNMWVKVGAYGYAAFIGFGTTTTSHWLSEAFAGALIGYAIGKTVGKSYRKFSDGSKEKSQASFYPYFSGSSAGIIIRASI